MKSSITATSYLNALLRYIAYFLFLLPGGRDAREIQALLRRLAGAAPASSPLGGAALRSPGSPCPPRRRSGGGSGPARRAAHARLRDDPAARGAHRRTVAAQRRVYLPHPAAARGRGPDPRRGVR